MENMPVKFEYKGKEFAGILSLVSGAGSTAHYHLYQNGNRYAGQLAYSEHLKEWQFSSQKGYTTDIAKILLEFIERNKKAGG